MKFLAKHYLGSVVFVGVATCAAVAFANSTASKKSDARSNLKQLGTALMMYAQDYDEFLPPMKNAAHVQQLLSPYLENESAFINPHTKKAFGIYLSLSGRSLEAVYKESYQKKQGVIAFYEATPRTHGARFVLRMAKPHSYKNGMPAWVSTGTFWQPAVESVSQLQWLKAKKAFKLP
ncbi:MAG: hypothetical protein JWN98_626 [Abditibacteriota bacterium]|nr:hypothetical protein [Abditibacteriota bacterium]